MLRELIRQASSIVGHLTRPASAPPATRADRDPGHSLLAVWKKAWTQGAQARWRGSAPPQNPHALGTRQAAAWDAGWRWADQQPDRRRSGVVRFAHAHRRSTDYTAPLVRRGTAAAAGLSALTLAAWLWRMRRRSRNRR